LLGGTIFRQRDNEKKHISLCMQYSISLKTDELSFAEHSSVNHIAREYVRDNFHNNTAEPFNWILERTKHRLLVAKYSASAVLKNLQNFGAYLLRLSARFLEIACNGWISAQVSMNLDEASGERSGMFISSADRTSTVGSINKVGKVCQEENGLLQL